MAGVCFGDFPNRLMDPIEVKSAAFETHLVRISALNEREKLAFGEHITHTFPTKRWEYPWALATWGPPTGRVLDTGSGTSPLPSLLAETASEVHSMDYRERHCESQRRIAAFHDRNVIAKAMDLTALEYEDNYFDRVYCISVMEHLPREMQPLAAAEMARVLRPGGLLIFTTDFADREILNNRDLIFDRNGLFKRFIVPSGLDVAGCMTLTPPDWPLYLQRIEWFSYQKFSSVGLALQKPLNPKAVPTAQPFFLGANLPWLGDRYGNDIGPSPYHPDWGWGFRHDEVTRLVATLSAAGIRHVRFWLLENAEGMILDEAGDVVGLHPAFLDNLRALVCAFRANGIEPYWTMLDANSSHERGDACLDRIMTRAVSRRRFIENALVPVMEAIAESGDAPIDLVNEPECLLRSKGVGIKPGDWPAVHAAISELAAAVRWLSPRRPISVGSGWLGPRALLDGWYEGLGLDFLDLHHYEPVEALPAAATLSPLRPIVLGEWGLSGLKSDWDEAPFNADRLFTEASRLRDEGYAGAFLWINSSWTQPLDSPLVREIGAAAQRIAALQG